MTMSNTSSLNNLIKDFNLQFKIKSIITLIVSGKKGFLKKLWKWNLDEIIVNKYWRKSDLFNEDSLLCSKYLKNYLEIIKDRISDNCRFNDIITIIKNKYVPDKDIFSLLEYKNTLSYWTLLIRHRQNIPLEEFINRKSRINLESWEYILRYKILTNKEIIEIVTGKYSLNDKKDVLRYQPRVLSVLKTINEYATNLNIKDEEVSYQILLTTVNNFYFKLSNGNLINTYPKFSWNFGWFIGYTFFNKETVKKADEIPLMTYGNTKYTSYCKVLKVRVYWKDLITTTAAKKVEIIREINLENRYKRSYE